MHGEDEIIARGARTLRVHVFKTNVNKQWQAEMLCEVMAAAFPLSKCNFDLQDVDNIFRIESFYAISSDVIDMLRRYGFHGEEL